MKSIALVLLTACFLSCKSSKTLTSDVLNSWVGHSKEQFIQYWGPPNQTTSNGGNGEIMIYTSHVYRPNGNYPIDYWEYKMLYVNASQEIYHWLVKKNPNPPQRIDVNLLIN